jgi:hypothetical protein
MDATLPLSPLLRPNTDSLRMTLSLAQAGHATALFAVGT